MFDKYYKDYEEPEVVLTEKKAEVPPIQNAQSPDQKAVIKSTENLYENQPFKYDA